ncbi:MAG TPA: hypothetical protein VGM75_16165 [Pseudonocardiaceae bacterium]|jgi:hypothetical protein
MSLSTRYGVDVLGIVAGGFLAVAAVAFSTSVAGWVGFGVFTGLTVLGAIGAIFANRPSTRIGHGVLGLVSLWALIAALTFTGPALIALVFADALAVALVALVDLTAHELTTERVVHQLEVHAPTAVSTVNTAA